MFIPYDLQNIIMDYVIQMNYGDIMNQFEYKMSFYKKKFVCIYDEKKVLPITLYSKIPCGELYYIYSNARIAFGNDYHWLNRSYVTKKNLDQKSYSELKICINKFSCRNYYHYTKDFFDYKEDAPHFLCDYDDDYRYQNLFLSRFDDIY